MSRRTGRLRLLIGAGAAVLTAACSQSAGVTPSTSPTPVPGVHAGAQLVAGGCGSTQLYRGGLPTWVEPTVHALSKMEGLPYAIGGPSPVAGFIFA